MPGIVLVEGVRTEADVSARVQPFIAQAQARLGQTVEADLPEVQAWRRAFSQMGIKPASNGLQS